MIVMGLIELSINPNYSKVNILIFSCDMYKLS